jgi:hypothetical protein
MIYPGYIIEPLTGSQHVRRILVRIYMSFIDKIEKSSKSSLKQTPGERCQANYRPESTEKNTTEKLNRNVDFLPLV